MLMRLPDGGQSDESVSLVSMNDKCLRLDLSLDDIEDLQDHVAVKANPYARRETSQPLGQNICEAPRLP